RQLFLSLMDDGAHFARFTTDDKFMSIVQSMKEKTQVRGDRTLFDLVVSAKHTQKMIYYVYLTLFIISFLYIVFLSSIFSTFSLDEDFQSLRRDLHIFKPQQMIPQSFSQYYKPQSSLSAAYENNPTSVTVPKNDDSSTSSIYDFIHFSYASSSTITGGMSCISFLQTTMQVYDITSVDSFDSLSDDDRELVISRLNSAITCMNDVFHDIPVHTLQAEVFGVELDSLLSQSVLTVNSFLYFMRVVAFYTVHGAGIQDIFIGTPLLHSLDPIISQAIFPLRHFNGEDLLELWGNLPMDEDELETMDPFKAQQAILRGAIFSTITRIHTQSHVNVLENLKQIHLNHTAKKIRASIVSVIVSIILNGGAAVFALISFLIQSKQTKVFERDLKISQKYFFIVEDVDFAENVVKEEKKETEEDEEDDVPMLKQVVKQQTGPVLGSDSALPSSNVPSSSSSSSSVGSIGNNSNNGNNGQNDGFGNGLKDYSSRILQPSSYLKEEKKETEADEEDDVPMLKQVVKQQTGPVLGSDSALPSSNVPSSSSSSSSVGSIGNNSNNGNNGQNDGFGNGLKDYSSRILQPSSYRNHNGLDVNGSGISQNISSTKLEEISMPSNGILGVGSVASHAITELSLHNIFNPTTNSMDGCRMVSFIIACFTIVINCFLCLLIVSGFRNTLNVTNEEMIFGSSIAALHSFQSHLMTVSQNILASNSSDTLVKYLVDVLFSSSLHSVVRDFTDKYAKYLSSSPYLNEHEEIGITGVMCDAALIGELLFRVSDVVDLDNVDGISGIEKYYIKNLHSAYLFLPQCVLLGEKCDILDDIVENTNLEYFALSDEQFTGNSSLVDVCDSLSTFYEYEELSTDTDGNIDAASFWTGLMDPFFLEVMQSHDLNAHHLFSSIEQTIGEAYVDFTSLRDMLRPTFVFCSIACFIAALIWILAGLVDISSLRVVLKSYERFWVRAVRKLHPNTLDPLDLLGKLSDMEPLKQTRTEGKFGTGDALVPIEAKNETTLPVRSILRISALSSTSYDENCENVPSITSLRIVSILMYCVCMVMFAIIALVIFSIVKSYQTSMTEKLIKLDNYSRHSVTLHVLFSSLIETTSHTIKMSSVALGSHLNSMLEKDFLYKSIGLNDMNSFYSHQTNSRRMADIFPMDSLQTYNVVHTLNSSIPDSIGSWKDEWNDSKLFSIYISRVVNVLDLDLTLPDPRLTSLIVDTEKVIELSLQNLGSELAEDSDKSYAITPLNLWLLVTMSIISLIFIVVLIGRRILQQIHSAIHILLYSTPLPVIQRGIKCIRQEKREWQKHF
ncbi:hypothetical protein ADUPG1_000411, partial [Aduncisulcus paluster]